MGKYEDYYERIQNGEKILDVANEAKHSITALYNRFADYGIIKTKKRLSADTWDIAYIRYKEGETIINIAKDLEVRTSTVYNQFAIRGYKTKPKEALNKADLLKDYSAGLSVADLAEKYKRTMTHIRYLIRT